MLARRRRRWANIKPALVQHLVLARVATDRNAYLSQLDPYLTSESFVRPGFISASHLFSHSKVSPSCSMVYHGRGAHMLFTGVASFDPKNVILE